MKLGKQDRAVIRAFTEKRELDGHFLTTDGITLDGRAGFLRHIAAWHADGKIHFQDLGSRNAQMIQNAVRKEAPKNDLAPGWTRGDRSNNPDMKMTHLSHGHYRISDADAGRLAKSVGKKLPRPGHELNVTLPDGRSAWLKRTPHRYGADAPKRGWVWAVMPVEPLPKWATEAAKNPSDPQRHARLLNPF